MSHSVSTIAESEMDIVWREQYVSAALNQKFAVAVPPGIYEGFRMVPKGSGDRVVTVEADPDTTDHVALYQTDDGYSIYIRRTTGDFDLDLSAFESETVYIAIEAEYAIDATTTADVVAYDQTEWDALTAAELGEIVMLGTIDVPAATNQIVAADINVDFISPPFLKTARRAFPYVPVVRDSEFSRARVYDGAFSAGGWEAPFWKLQVGSGNGHWRFSTTEAVAGLSSLELQASATASTIGTILRQDIGAPVTEGQLIRVEYQIKVLIAATSGNPQLSFRFLNTETDATSTLSHALDVSGTDANFRKETLTLEVPAGVDILDVLDVDGNTIQVGSTGAVLRIDLLQVWLERADDTTRDAPDSGHKYLTNAIWNSLNSAWVDGRMGYDSPTAGGGGIVIERADNDSTSADQVGLQVAGGIIVGNDLQNSSAHADTPRLVTNGASSFTRHLVAEFHDNQAIGDEIVRLYRAVGTERDFEITINAAWDEANTQWSADNGAAPSYRWSFGDSALQWQKHGSGDTDPWTDTAWADTFWKHAGKFIEAFDAVFTFVGVSTVSNPAATTGVTENSLYAKNVPKSWGHIQIVSGSASIENGFNVGSVTSASGDLAVTFATSLGDTFAAVVASTDAVRHTVQVHSITASDFSVALTDDGGTALDLSTGTADIYFVVHGEQNP